jgi:hypothetical protein
LADDKKYRVGDFTIDVAQFRVIHGSEVVPVEPKVFDLLVHLIRHRDRVLSRDELFRQVWDGREVSDATLSNHVKSARRALGDSGELQQTILGREARRAGTPDREHAGREGDAGAGVRLLEAHRGSPGVAARGRTRCATIHATSSAFASCWPGWAWMTQR